jgi:hypothetical protein
MDSPRPHLRRDGAPPAHAVHRGLTELAMPTQCAWDCACPAHVRIRTGLTPPTSAPGPGSPPALPRRGFPPAHAVRRDGWTVQIGSSSESAFFAHAGVATVAVVPPDVRLWPVSVCVRACARACAYALCVCACVCGGVCACVCARASVVAQASICIHRHGSRSGGGRSGGESCCLARLLQAAAAAGGSQGEGAAERKVNGRYALSPRRPAPGRRARVCWRVHGCACVVMRAHAHARARTHTPTHAHTNTHTQSIRTRTHIHSNSRVPVPAAADRGARASAARLAARQRVRS